MSDIAKAKRNVRRMIDAGADKAKIDEYLALEGLSAAQLRAAGPENQPRQVTPRPAPRPRPPIEAYNPIIKPAAPTPAPTGKLPVRPELLAPMQEVARRRDRPEVRIGGPSVKRMLTAPAPKPKPAVDPAINSIFGGTLQDAPDYSYPAMKERHQQELVANITNPYAIRRRKAWLDASIPTSGLGDRMLEMGKRSALRVGSGGARVIAAGMNALDDGFGDALTQRADDVDQYLSRRVEGETTLKDLKTDFNIGRAGRFILEQGAGSAADMGLLATGSGVIPYFFSQSGNIGQQRALNNGTGTATLTDVAKAAPAAAVSTAAERLGTKYLGGEIGGNLMVRLGGAAVSEAATEGVQSFAEYTGGSLGTDTGFDLGEAGRVTRDGAITGGIVGPGLRVAIGEAPAAVRNVIDMAVEMRQAQQERDAFSPLAQALALDAFRPAQSGPAPEPVEAAPRRVEPRSVAPAAATIPEAPEPVAAMPRRVEPQTTAPIARTVPEAPVPVEPAAIASPEPVKAPAALEPASSPAAAVAPVAATKAQPVAEAPAIPAAPKPGAAREEVRRVTIPTGGKIDTRMELVSADDIAQAEGAKQNRDRDRAASEAQIMAIVGRFDPEQLGDDNYTDRGAPIVGPDGTIESGNGRVQAIERIFAERPELAQQYRDFIESQGFDTSGIERPVLIRRRLTEMDDDALRAFITGSNADTKQELSAPERATQDAADILTPELAASYGGGALNSQRNGNFVRGFIDAVPAGQRSGFMDEKGNLSTQGIARIENAMLARAFGNGTEAGKRFLSKAIESTDNRTRTLTGALSEASPKWGGLVDAVRSGAVASQYDLTDKVLEAIGIVADARSDGQGVANILDSDDMYDRLDPIVRDIIEAFHSPTGARLKSKAKIAAMLERYAGLAQEQRAAPDMFGDVVQRAPKDLMAEAFADGDLLAVAAEDKAPAPEKSEPMLDVLDDATPKRAPARANADTNADDTDIPGIDEPSAAAPAYLADTAGYEPKFIEKAFTNRASFFDGVARGSLGIDPDAFVLLPGPKQVAMLIPAVRRAFGITVKVEPGVADRFAIDQMLDMLQNVQGMAHILGIPAKGIGLGGSLGLVIEGKSRSLGWYRPDTGVIGLAKRSNSFAHEWAHAFDHFLLEKIGARDGDSRGVGLSGAIRQMGANLADASGIPNRDVRDAFIHLLNTMFFDKAGLATRLLDLESKLARARTDKTQAEYQAQIDNIKAGNSRARGISTGYADLAKSLGASTGPEYWTSPTEMLARAFEAYVSYKADMAGLSTEVIGKGDDAYLSDADERFAKAFPKGTERIEIFEALDNVFSHVAAQQVLGPGVAAMPDPAARTSRNPFESPATVPAQERNIFKAAIGREFDALWSAAEARRKRLRDRPESKEATVLRHIHDAVSFFKYGMSPRLKMLGRRYNSASIRELHDLLTHNPGEKSTGRDYLRGIELRTNQYQNVIDRLIGNYNAASKHSRTRELSVADSDHLRDLLISETVAPSSTAMQTLAAGLRRLSDDIFYHMRNAGIDVGYARNGHLQRVYDDAIIGGDEAGFLTQAAKAYEIAFRRDWGDADTVLNDDEAFSEFMAKARELHRRGHAEIKAPYGAVRDVRKVIAGLNRAIKTAETAGNDTGALQGRVAEADEKLSEAFGELYDTVQPAWAKQAASDWLFKIRATAPHDVDSRGPDGNFMKQRTLPPEADKLLEKYMVRDPVSVMMSYAGGAARRIEYASRFGAKNEKVDALFDRMAAEGVSVAGQRQVREIFDLTTSGSTSKLPAGVQWVTEAIHVIYGTISLLPRAVWSSLSESLTAGLHAGNARFAIGAFADLMGAVVRTRGARGRAELARFVGIVSARGGHGVLTERYGGSYANDTFLSEKASKMFYQTGLVALTRAQQGQMVGTAHAFLDWMSGWVVDGANAAPGSKAYGLRQDGIARLQEHGISDADAFAKRIRTLDRLPTPADLVDGDPFAYDWITATDRFIKGSIQTPTVMSRPEAASSSVGRLCYGIMSFNYEFYRNIIKGSAIRVGQKFERRRQTALGTGATGPVAVAKGAAAVAPDLTTGLLAGGAVLVAGQFLVTSLRMFLFDKERWEELDEKDGLLDHLVATAFSRSFATPLDPMVQAYTGWKYNGSAMSNLVGPAPSNILQQVDAIGKASARNSPKTNTAEYNRAKALYRLGIGPGSGLLLSMVPGGPIVQGLAGSGTMAVTSSTAADGFAEAVIGEKGSSTDPETGEITGPPKKKGADPSGISHKTAYGY